MLEICKVYHTKIQSFKGGRWRYKLKQCLKFAKSTIQRTRNSRVDVGLQTYSVLEICKVDHTKIQGFKGGRWRYKLIVQIEICEVYHTKIQKKGWTLALQT